MRIDELIIDGFKSYPVRTHISGWDSSFNAITGLNGSGKSNILDAICFVLGITNLQTVRAANLQDLIYKRGQAGITKASVTIVFDNSDRSKSPVSFENYSQITVTRQVAMGGQSKYLVNGHKATQQTVQNLFQSVQLNINNPNFLIMQGKITKVLNMKPPEILAMIEEAAGTRMFEDRKEKAVKTMAKKDKKIDEITDLLDNEIVPKLDNLREQKRSFLEYQKASSELERLTRLSKAHEWQTLRTRLQERQGNVDAWKQEVASREREVEELKRQVAGIEKELAAIEKKRDKEIAKGGKFQALSDRLKELVREHVRIKTLVDLKVSSVEDDERNIQADREALATALSTRDEKKAQLDSLSEFFTALKEEHDASMAAMNKQDELLQTLLTGVTGSKDEGAGGYMGQLANARSRQAGAGTEIEQAKLRIEHLEREVKEKEPRAAKAQKENAGLLKELEGARKRVSDMEAKLSQLGWNEEKERELLASKSKESKSVIELLERRDALKSRLSGLDFSYSDPVQNFDRSKVKGLVATLINLDKENHKMSTALEICAGGRLYNVVVENEKIGSQLLANGKLKRRVTLIPLNKINAFVAAAEKIGAAQKLAPGKVDLALSLVGYDEEVMAAMGYVFGNTLICADAATAKQVTFHQAVRMKSVTLDGDVYDPTGTLSGGSKPSTSGVLVKVQELNAVEKELSDSKGRLNRIEQELAQTKGFGKLRRDIDLKRHEVTLLEEQVNSSNATRIITEVEKCKESIVSLKETISEATRRQKQAAEEVKTLEKDMDDFNNNKDSKLKQLKSDVKDRKAAVQKSSSVIKAKQNAIRTAELELEQLEAEVQNAQREEKEAEDNLRRTRSELDNLRQELQAAQEEHDAAEAQLAQERATLSAYDDELNVLHTALKAKRQEIVDAELNIKQVTHEIEKVALDCSTAEKSLKQLEAQFEWIVAEQKFFGQPGTAYDFSRNNMHEIKKTCKKLEEQQQGMRKKVNPKVMNMIDSVEKKETALKQMMATVLKDKSKIKATIEELDRYKRDALQTTWEKVNADFGAIFAELLPGNFSKLQPPEGQDITEGLEVKVRLGSVWKQSLTELSGGQRSLIALSLIMALLQFKPAPMYILDEIDAALDLSHTQNMGRLFKTRFKQSQIIVVSLKGELFRSAPVLFTAKFRDGVSVVSRHQAGH